MRPGADLLLRIPPERRLAGTMCVAMSAHKPSSCPLMPCVRYCSTQTAPGAKRDWRARREMEVLSVSSFPAQSSVFTISSFGKRP